MFQVNIGCLSQYGSAKDLPTKSDHDWSLIHDSALRSIDNLGNKYLIFFSGVKGPYKQVDPRMKKDTQAKRGNATNKRLQKRKLKGKKTKPERLSKKQ